MFLNQLETQVLKESFIELANYVAKVDNELSEKETQYLEAYLYEMDMAPVEYTIRNLELEQILAEVKDEKTKNIFFLEILGLIFVDGGYRVEERLTIDKIRSSFGFSVEKYQSYKEWIIRMNALYTEGVQLLGA